MKIIAVVLAIIGITATAHAERAQLIIVTPKGVIRVPMVQIESSMQGYMVFWGKHPMTDQMVGCKVSSRVLYKGGRRMDSLLININLDKKPNFICRNVEDPMVSSSKLLFTAKIFAESN